jgi:hypothetical protein
LDSCPLLSNQHAEQPVRWFRIKLQVVKGEEMLSTSLLMRDDNLYVCGFINQNGAVYKLVDNENRESFLPQDHTTTYLQLGVNYKSLLQAKDRNDIVTKLMHEKLGRGFAMDAVHVLSKSGGWYQYQHWAGTGWLDHHILRVCKDATYLQRLCS